MRVQELLETASEDRELITLSSAIYHALTPFMGDLDYDSGTLFDVPEEQLIRLDKVGNITKTTLPEVGDITIEIQGGDPFLERATDPGQTITDYEGKELYGFYEEDTRTIVLNLELINKQRMKTSITHELRHALDEIKSGTYASGNAKRYFTPKNKSHRKNDPYSTTQYRAQPAEINARFVELLDIMSKRIPKWYASNMLDAKDIRQQLTKDFNSLLIKYEIADLFPERTRSPAYKRLIKRAYDFIQQEIAKIESQPGVTKRASGNW